MAFDDDEEDDVPQQTEEDQRKSAADYAAIQERLRRKDPGWNMFDNTTPKYSAVYDEGGDKGEPDYPNAPIIQGPPEPDYAATKQGAEYPFQPPTLAQPQGAPPPIRTFAGNTETTPQQGLGAAYQSLGPVAQEKYRYLMQHRQDILRGTYGPHQAAALTDISRQMADLIHVHEEGEARGAAKALALHPSIANPTGAALAVPLAAPIFSDRQKQLIGQLQASEQEFKMMANRGEIGEDEIRKGVEYYQQAYKSITPIGMQGQKPNQPGTIKVDQTTGKAYTHDKDGVVQELDNTPAYPSLAHEPSHQAHVTIQKYAELYHTDIATATKIAMAAEMAVKGQPIPPGFLPADLKPAGKGAGEKKGPGEAPMTEDKFHATAIKAEQHLGKVWDADQAPLSTTHPAGPKRLWGNRAEYIHDEMAKMGLTKQGSEPGDRSYKGYLDSWNALHGEKGQQAAPGAPEAVGAPAQSAPAQQPAPEVAKLATDQWPKIYDQAVKANEPMAAVMQRVPFLTKKMNGNFLNLSPDERGVYALAMQAARKYDKTIPSFWDDPKYLQKMGAVLPKPAGAFADDRSRGRR